jgi:hypothetical protein
MLKQVKKIRLTKNVHRLGPGLITGAVTGFRRSGVGTAG